MRNKCLLSFCLFPIFTITVLAEQKVALKDLPAAVQKTVSEQTKNSTLRGLSREIENGKTCYEAETTLNGKSRDLLIDPSGAIIEVEESLSFESLPESARSALQREARSGNILRVESVTRKSLTFYEAVIKRDGKKSEVSVNGDGSRHKD